jgi:hypothetical protein
MNALRVEHYIGRAADFYAGMDFLRDSEDHAYASALLAIHSAISYADALRSGPRDDKLYAEDHRSSIESLRRLIGQKGLSDKSGFAHFEYLLSMKSFVSYGARRLDRRRSKEIVNHAERFANWVSRVAQRLSVEGWTHDDN